MGLLICEPCALEKVGRLHPADHLLCQRFFPYPHLRDVVEHISVAAAQVFG